MKKVIFIYLFITLLPLELVFGLKDPVSPKVPVINEKEKPKIKKKDPGPEIRKESSALAVTITFQNNIKLDGSIKFPSEFIEIKSRVKGFDFRKKIKWKDIKNIKITEWQPKKSVKKNPGLTLYYFYPVKFLITSKEESIFEFTGSITPLHKLTLTNQYGSTDIYSYFIDYWKITGKKTGYWLNSRTSDFNYPFRNPHKKIFIIIEFK